MVPISVVKYTGYIFYFTVLSRDCFCIRKSTRFKCSDIFSKFTVSISKLTTTIKF